MLEYYTSFEFSYKAKFYPTVAQSCLNPTGFI